MSKCHDCTLHSSLSSESCSWGLSWVFIRAELSGRLQRLWARCVVFPLRWHGIGHVWWLIEHENTRRHSRKTWNCQPAFLLCRRVEADSGGQTDDPLDLNTLSLTTPRWQPAEGCWVVSGWVLGNEGLWVPHSQSSLSLCRSSVTPRLMRVYWGCCACLLSQNRAPNAKQQCASTVLPFRSGTQSFFFWQIILERCGKAGLSKTVKINRMEVTFLSNQSI